MSYVLGEHRFERCSTPRVSKRRRNTLWICPKCGQPWVLRYAAGIQGEPHMDTDRPVWGWWHWAGWPDLLKPAERVS